MTANNLEQFFSNIYDEFNNRNIDEVLATFHKDVEWPNGWEGGYVNGHDEVRAYWTRQWKEIDPKVWPLSVSENNNRAEVTVHQLVKDKQGNILFDKNIKHIYSLENGLVKKMEIVDSY